MEDLLNLTRETCSEKRRELMGRVADNFAEGADKYSDRELFLFSEVVTELLDCLDVKCRQTLSQKIAHVKETPHDLAVSLANDEISVAQPVLEHSPVLTGSDLKSIVETKGMEHRLSISKRNDLDESLTDALIGYDESEVLQSVSSNKQAPISENGFIKLSEKALEDETILANLSKRSDITAVAARNVLPLLDANAQQKLLGLISTDGSALCNLVSEANRKTSARKLKDARKRIETKVLINAVQSGESSLDDALATLINQNRAMDCATFLSAVSGMPEPQVANALFKNNGETISLLCKALEVSQSTFALISHMRCIRLKLRQAREDNLIADYENIDIEAAQRTLRFVKMRTKVAIM